MKISLSQYAGFCDGVERAYVMVERMIDDPKIKKPIFILGSLVHNQDVVKRIEKMGVKKIHVDRNVFKTLDKMKSKIGILVITAHGIGPKIYDFAEKKGIAVVDTTCPRVIKVQRLAKIFKERNNQIVIVGEKDHKEVQGIYEWADRKAVFVETDKEFRKLKLDPKKKISVISQTTQNQEFVKKAWEYIKNKYKNVEIVDTICLTTQNRQDEVRKKAGKNDIVIVIGSPESANSTRLWEIAEEINPRSHFIERAGQIKNSWFKNCQKAWLTAGASTPKWIIDEVMEKIKNLSKE